MDLDELSNALLQATYDRRARVEAAIAALEPLCAPVHLHDARVSLQSTSNGSARLKIKLLHPAQPKKPIVVKARRTRGPAVAPRLKALIEKSNTPVAIGTASKHLGVGVPNLYTVIRKNPKQFKRPGPGLVALA